MSQTAYNTKPAVASEGMISSSSMVNDIIACVADATNGAIKFGRYVRIKTPPAAGGNPVVELPDATGEITGDTGFGVVVRDTSIENSDADSFDGYATGEMLSVMIRGRIWVTSEDAVAAARAPAFVRFSAGVGEELGRFRTDADTADAVAAPGAHFMNTCDAAGLVELEVDLQD